jgi:hypothetical protein
VNILSELNEIISACGIPAETGIFKNKIPSVYAVVTPMSDSFDCFADDKPNSDVQEARMSIFSKNNYTEIKNKIVSELIKRDFTVTDRRFVGSEENYYNYAIDVRKYYDVNFEK